MKETNHPHPNETPVLPRLCKYLRTKAYFLEGPLDPSLQASDDVTQYWCLHSMHSVGPDGEFVCPEDCSPHRSCFEE